MYHRIVISFVSIRIHDVIDDVISFHYRPNLWTAIFPFISQLKYLKCRNFSWRSCLHIPLSISHPVKKVCRNLKMTTFLNMSKYYPQYEVDIRYEMIVLNYARAKYFDGDDVIDDVTGWPENCSSYSCLGKVDSWSKLQGQYLAIVFLCYTCIKNISINKTFQDRRSKVTHAY